MIDLFDLYMGPTTLGLSEPGSNSNEGVLYIANLTGRK